MLTTEKFDAADFKWDVSLTDGTVVELKPNGSNIKVEWKDRYTYLEKVIKT